MNNFELPNLTIVEGDLNPPQIKKTVTIGERRFPLNKSRSKFVSVGLVNTCEYSPCIQLSGIKGECLIFSESEWDELLEYQGVITNYLYTNEKAQNINGWSFSIHFEFISSARVVKLFKDDTYIYLGYETICKLWELLPLIKYTIKLFKNQQFMTYFRVIKISLKNRPNQVETATDILQATEGFPTENPSLVWELLTLYPDVFEQECQE
jgi:hypothetical protein